MNPRAKDHRTPAELLAERCRILGLAAQVCDSTGARIDREARVPGSDTEIASLAREAARRAIAGSDIPPAQWEAGTMLAIPVENSVVLAHLPQGDGRALWKSLCLTRDDLVARASAAVLLKDFSGKLIQSYEETYTLFRVMRLLASAAAPIQQINMVCRNVQQTLPFRWVAVAFRDHDKVIDELRGQLIIEGDIQGKREILQRCITSMVQSSDHDGWTRVLSPADNELAAHLGAEIVGDPITYDGAVIGLILAGNKTGPEGDIASPEMQFIDALADFLGTFHENIARFSEQRSMSMGTLHALTAAIDAKDRYTCGHSERVAFLSQCIARELGIGPEQCERIRIAGLVHDVGKIGVPESILCKPGKLTDEEFTAIKRHPEIGYNILQGISLLGDTLPGVLHHHERWDGRGYPHGLRGSDIPHIARIIGLADTFDAMSSSRSYRPALARPLVLSEISRCAGAQFDPQIVQAFSRVNLAEYDALLGRQSAVDPAPLRVAA